MILIFRIITLRRQITSKFPNDCEITISLQGAKLQFFR